MSLFQKSQQVSGASPVEQARFRLTQQRRNAVGALWTIVAFSVINFFAALGGTYFLFSAEIPLFVTQVCRVLVDEMALEGMDVSVLIPVSYVLAVLLILPYLITALLAKKRRGALVTALVFWSIDTALCVLMIFSGDLTMLLDIVIHVVGIYEIATGIKADKALAALPEEEPEQPEADSFV